jgi:hypothetical protein
MPRSTSHARKPATDSGEAGSALIPRPLHQSSKIAKSLLYARRVALAFCWRASSLAFSTSGDSRTLLRPPCLVVSTGLRFPLR